MKIKKRVAPDLPELDLAPRRSISMSGEDFEKFKEGDKKSKGGSSKRLKVLSSETSQKSALRKIHTRSAKRQLTEKKSKAGLKSHFSKVGEEKSFTPRLKTRAVTSIGGDSD